MQTLRTFFGGLKLPKVVMNFPLLLGGLRISPVVLCCTAIVSVPLRAVSPDCIGVSSAIVDGIAHGQVEEAQRIALNVLAGDVSHFEPVCAGILLNGAASSFLLSGRFEEALRLAEESLTYLQRGLSTDDPVFLHPLHLLAMLYLVEGSTGKARETLHRMETIRVTSPQDRALLREVSAGVLKREGKLKEAEVNYIAALAAISEAGRENSADSATVHLSLAHLYVEEHRFSDALKTVDVALATLERAKDTVPLDRIQALNVRAVLYTYQGRWRDAEIDLGDAVSLARSQPHLDPVALEPIVTNYLQVLRKLHRKEAQSIEAWAATLRTETLASRQTVDVRALSGARSVGRQ